MDKDRKIIRDLAGRYYNMASSDKNTEKIGLYKAVNDLKMIRPVVTLPVIALPSAFGLPLNEINIDGGLDLKCESERARAVEFRFRYLLLVMKHFPCDMYLRPYYPVLKHCYLGGLQGIEPKGRSIPAPGGHLASSEYCDMLKTEEDLEKLHYVPASYDRDATMEEFSFVADLIGDIMPVQVRGHFTQGLPGWDYISGLRGVTPLLGDLIDRPEFMHKIMRKITDAYIKSVGEAVKLNLFSANDPDFHWRPAFTDSLAPVGDYDSVKPANIWGRGAAQIFTSVSPAMLDEFDIQYQIEATKDFGLVYYGCCERLDNKIHILKKLKNLRKIAVTPWADINAASDKIGRDYVMAVKTNSAYISAGFDEDAVRGELKGILDAAKRNNCSIEIMLGDISTLANNPQNLVKWAQTAMEAVMDY